MQKSIVNDLSALGRHAPMGLTQAILEITRGSAATWGGARREFGARGGGPFLFGAFCAADAMFAPVAFRFETYGVQLRDADAAAYVAALLQLDAMREWAAAARAEGDVIAHYDAAALAAGAELVPAASA